MTLKPPHTVLNLIHWSSLLNLLTLVPEPLREGVLFYEGYQIPDPECKFTPYTRPEISKVYMRMVSPSLDKIPASVKEEFVNNVKKGRMNAMCSILDRHPKLAYLPFAEHENAGVISMILDGNDQDMAVAARLYGADPDYRDRTGMTAMHRFALRDNKPLVKFLLTLGASPLLTLTDGKTTPAQLAKEKGCRKVIQTLVAEENKRRQALIAAVMPAGAAEQNDTEKVNNDKPSEESPVQAVESQPPAGRATEPEQQPNTTQQPMDTTPVPTDTTPRPMDTTAAPPPTDAQNTEQIPEQPSQEELQLLREQQEALNTMIGDAAAPDPSQPPPRLFVIEPGANFDDIQPM